MAPDAPRMRRGPAKPARRPGCAWARLACALALGVLAACSPAAPPVSAPPVPAAPEPLAAVRIAARLAEPGLADLTGLEADVARARLADAGLTPQVVALGDASTVTGQFPTAGSAAPADGLVTVWIGEPPVLPRPATRAPQDAATEHPPPARPAPARASEPVATTPPPRPAPSAPREHPSSRPAPAPSRDAADADRREPVGRVLSGRASWYGPGFAGRTTACGDRFDPGALTLASRELACGSRVRITGPDGAHVEATVTDWGPAAWTGRRFDLSQATFAAIAPLGAGVVDVTVERRGAGS